MKKLGNFILGFLSVILLLVLTLSLVIKKEFSRDTIKEALRDTDFSFIKESLGEDTEEIIDAIEEILTYVDIPDNIVDKLLNSEGTKNFVGVYISNTVDYFLDNKNNVPLTGEDLKNLIKDNLDIIQSELPSKDKEYLEEYESNIYKYIDENEEDIISLFPEPKEIFSEVDLDTVKLNDQITLGDIVKGLSLITSMNFIIILSLVIVLLLGIIVLLNIKSKKYLKVIANTLFTYFILVLILTIIVIIAKYILTDIPTLNVFIKNMITYFMISLFSSLILSIILENIYKKVKSKQKIAK